MHQFPVKFYVVGKSDNPRRGRPTEHPLLPAFAGRDAGEQGVGGFVVRDLLCGVARCAGFRKLFCGDEYLDVAEENFVAVVLQEDVAVAPFAEIGNFAESEGQEIYECRVLQHFPAYFKQLAPKRHKRRKK